MAQKLNAEGVPTPSGKGQWQHVQVARVYKRLAAWPPTVEIKVLFEKKNSCFRRAKAQPQTPYDFKVSHQHNYPQAFAAELQISPDTPKNHTWKKATRFHASDLSFVQSTALSQQQFLPCGVSFVPCTVLFSTAVFGVATHFSQQQFLPCGVSFVPCTVHFSAPVFRTAVLISQPR